MKSPHTASPPSFQRITIAAHPQLPQAFAAADEIAAFLRSRGFQVDTAAFGEPALRDKITRRQTDLLIALGGDGTMLRAGHLCAPHDVPILGINLGKFGFLTAIQREEWRESLEKLLNGEGWVEHRMMLTAEQTRNGETIGKWDVLNEVFIGRGAVVRPVHLETQVDGRFLSTYVADGLVAATPTGSTAYALAAGGPILPPELRNILLVPVAPHLSIDRAIVLSEGASVTITVRSAYQAIISHDGHAPTSLEEGDQVHVRSGHHTVKFVRIQDPGYFYRNLTPYMYNSPLTGKTP
jgi:NAD+ kinase